MIILVAVVVSMIVAYCAHLRMTNRNKPSVTDRGVYRKVLREPLLLLDKGIYENPYNYARKRGKLVATSRQLLLAEKRINASFRDKIPWCMPPIYGDVEMKGAFPSIETCRLQALCNTMTKNIGVFTAEFNTHKDKFMDNPEKLGYGGRYGRIIVNRAGKEFSEDFVNTRKILESSADYERTQVFNDYANTYFMATAFTVLYPGASIRPHFGPTNYKYRIHLCIDIDGIGGIVTAHGTRFWNKGQIFILDDSYLHAGFYDGTRPRVILLVDIAKQDLGPEHVDRVVDEEN
jgi:hypothetical protein